MVMYFVTVVHFLGYLDIAVTDFVSSEANNWNNYLQLFPGFLVIGLFP